jgi:hypothetical protein
MGKTVLSVVGALAVLAFLAAPASALSVLSGLSEGDHTIGFSGSGTTFAHSDQFATSPVTPAASPPDPATAINLGAAVVNDLAGNGVFDLGVDTILRATLAQQSILYGGGHAIFSVDFVDIITGTELTFAFGNLQETTVAAAGGDGAPALGAVTILDALTASAGAGTGAELSDTDGDGDIEFGSVFDLDGSYGDYNRDGVDDADGAGDRDRPFLAIWESNADTYKAQGAPTFDADDDDVDGDTNLVNLLGIKPPAVDNLWVGDPWTGPLGSPVDIAGIEFGPMAVGNATPEADPGLTDDSYGKLLALFAFDTVGALGLPAFATITSVNTAPTVASPFSKVDIVGLNAGVPDASKLARVELVGGRLLDLLTYGSNRIFTLDGDYQFDPVDGSVHWSFLEFSNNPTLLAPVTVIPEPATMGLLLTSMVGLAGVGLRRRKRK